MNNQLQSKSPTRIFRWVTVMLLLTLCGYSTMAQVTVNPGAGSYATLNAAFSAINSGTHTGAITITITGNTTEPAVSVPLLRSFAPSSYTSISIMPSGGNWTINSAAIPTASRGVIELYGADNVTIDGDDPGTGGTRNLSFVVAPVTSTGVAAIRLASTSLTGTDGADNNTVKNCIITGSRPTAISTTTNYGINMSNSSAISTGAYSSLNTLIENNLITRCYQGIFANGTSATYPNTGTIIRNNTLGSAVAADNIGNRAINISYSSITAGATSAIIEGNDMRVGDVSPSGAGYSASIGGIEVGTVNSGLKIRNNNIHDIYQPTTSGYGAFGINITGSTNCDNIEISNNYIVNVVASKYTTTVASSFVAYGIRYSAGATLQKINYNTIVLPNTTTGITVNYVNYGIYTVSTATISEFRNNIIVNQNVGTGTMGFYAAATTNISGGTVNYNDYFVPSGNVGFYNALTQTTLANWQTATSKDANSISVLPGFISGTDFHISVASTSVNALGTPVAGITTDFDGNTRDVSTPDIGADEYTPLVCGSAVGGTISPSSTSKCVGQTYTMSTTGSSLGGGVTYQWQVSNTSGSGYVNVSGGSGANTTSYTTGALVAGTYYYVLEVTCANCGPCSQYSSELTVVVNTLPTVTLSPGSASFCSPGGTPVTLTAGGAVTYAWSPTSGLTPTSGSPVSANPSSTTTYTVTGTDANGCTNNASAVITVGQNPIITSTTATPPAVCSGSNSQLDVSVLLPGCRDVIITEVSGFETATTGGTGGGGTISPAGIIDPIELTNISTSPVDISGWQLQITGTTPGVFVIPTGNIVPAGATFVISRGSSGGAAIPGVFAPSSITTSGSATSQGIILSSGSIIKDVVAINGGTPFNPVGTGTPVVTAADWSGNVASSSSTGGIRRMVATDSNTASDWTVSGGGNTINFGVVNLVYNFTPCTISYLWSPSTFIGGQTTLQNPLATAVTATTSYSVTVTDANGCTATSGVTVTSAPLTCSTATFTSPNCAGSNFSVTANPSNGGAPYSYSWSDGVGGVYPTTQTITANLPAGTYTFVCTVTDACLVTCTSSVTVTVNPLPTVVLNPSSGLYCAPGTGVTLTAGGASTYSWSPTAGLAPTSGSPVVATPSSTTTYIVTGTDGNGCTSSASSTITVAAAVTGVTASASANPVCSSAPFDLTSSASQVNTIISQGFESGAAGWSFLDSSSTGTNLAQQLWHIQAAPYTDGTGSATFSNFSVIGNAFAYTNSDAGGSGSQTRTFMVSPSFSTVGYTGTGTLTFKQGYRYWSSSSPAEQVKVQISSDGGTTWTDLVDYATVTNTAIVGITTNLLQTTASVSVTIPAPFMGLPSVQLRWRYLSNWGYYWIVDDIDLSGNYTALNYAWTSTPSGFTSGIQNPTGVTQTLNTNYSVLVTGAGGCTATASTGVVNTNPLPTPSISGTLAFCAGGSTTLDAGVYSSYLWNTGATTQTIAVNTAGTFTVTVTDGNSCVGTSASVSTTVNPLPTPSITGTLAFCAGGSTTLDAGVYSSYLWNTGATTQTIAVNTAGTFTVTVTDGNSCTGTSASVSTTVNPLPTPSITGTLAFCAGGSTTLDAGVYSSYLWNTGATTQTISVNTAGTFTVTVTDGNGCEGSASVSTTVNPLPTPSITGTLAFCAGGSTTLDAGAYSGYSWSTGATTQTISVNTAGTFTVTVTDGNGCEGSASVSTTVNPLPTPSITGTLAFCAGGSTTLDAGVYSGYSWSTGATTQTISVNTAGTFTVTVTDGNGCTGTSASVSTTVNPLPTPSITGTLTFCPSGSTTLDAGAYSGYFWNTGATTQTILVNTAGTFSVTVVDGNGCSGTSASVSTSITPAPTAVISGDANICTGNSTNLTINFTGTAPWLYAINGGTPVSTSTNPETVSVSPVATTVYTITSLSDASCSGSGTGSATVTVSAAAPSGSSVITSIPVSGCPTNVVSVTTNVFATATSYTWSAPLGCLINGLPSPQTTVSNTVSITLGPIPGNSSGWQICVFAANACGQTNTGCSWIRGSLSTPAAITGSTVACPNTGPVNYSTAAVSGASSYLWTITGDASVSGTGITGAVTFGPAFTTGQLCVRALLPCGYQSAQRCMTIANGTPLLGSMIGTFTVCPGANNVAYSVPAAAGAASYTWTVPVGATITGGQGTNAITVSFGPSYTASNICVYATSVCGIQSLLRCRTVASNKPNMPGNMVGASTGVCGQTITYSVAAVPGATSYTWSVTGGAVFGTPNGSSSIDVVYPPNFGTGQLCVTANNGCGSSTARCIPLKGIPANPGVITGPTLVCANDAAVTYSIAAVAGATGYVWTLPAGATFVSGQGSTSITIDYGVVGGTITVVATGSCGVSGTRSLTITMNCKLSSSALPGATVNAYPNPVSTQLNVELDAIAAGTYTVELLDVAGRVIYTNEMVATVGLNNNTIDVATFARGVYTLSVKNADGFAKQIRVAVQ